MKNTRVKTLRGNKWQIDRELVLMKEKEYISKDKELRVKIIQFYYDMLAAEYRER